MACFGRAGYQATTIDRIAAEAGLSKGSVYRFFASKDDVLLAILDLYEQELNAKLTAIFAATNDPLDRIRRSLRIALAYISDRSELDRVWSEFQQHPEARDRIADVYGATRQTIEGQIQAGIDAGLLADQPVQATADMIMALHDGLLVLGQVEPGFDLLKRFDAAWPVIERALAHR